MGGGTEFFNCDKCYHPIMAYWMKGEGTPNRECPNCKRIEKEKRRRAGKPDPPQKSPDVSDNQTARRKASRSGHIRGTDTPQRL